MSFTIQMSKQFTINTDPQKRCYNGCHFSSEQVWTNWSNLVSGINTKEDADNKLKYWVELNNFAVSQRGENARAKFRIIEC